MPSVWHNAVSHNAVSSAPEGEVRADGRLPTPLDLDPWWDLFLPALCGDVGPALHAVDVAVRDDGEMDGDLLAVAARACFVLGFPVQARRFLGMALVEGGEEAERLAVLVGMEARRTAERWVMSRRPAPVRADVACDLAARCLNEGDEAGAQEAVRAALAILPGHREAQRWSRFLSAGEPVGPVWRQARRERSTPSPRALQRDADALAPLRSGGYLSQERLRRRLYGVAGNLVPVSLSTGLGALAAAGVQTLRFTWSYVYARLPPTDPRVALELLADDVVSLVGEGRDPRGAAAALLDGAARCGEPIATEAARLVEGLAARDQRLVMLPDDVALRRARDGSGGWDGLRRRPQRFHEAAVPDRGRVEAVDERARAPQH